MEHFLSKIWTTSLYMYIYYLKQTIKISPLTLCIIIRALTRILKTGVQDSHLAKRRSPTGKSGSPTQKKMESHQFVHTVYLFHFSRKWYIWIIFRLTDFNPISINGLFLLNKTKYFAIFSCNLNTHFFVWPYQNKRLNCWYLFYITTDRQERQAGRQTAVLWFV